MNTNTADNNKRIFTVSDTTAEMLNLLHDFMALQCRIIALFEGKDEGDNVIDATVATYNAMRDAIAANVKNNIEDVTSMQI